MSIGLTFCLERHVPYTGNKYNYKMYLYTGDPASKSTSIDWKEGMDLTKKIAAMGASRKRKHGLPRTFFSWFLDNDDPSADDIAEVRGTGDCFNIVT
jgi:hypothetical protein